MRVELDILDNEPCVDAAFVADCGVTKIRRYGPTVSFLVALAAAAV